jgi:hypothetical protein
MITNLVRIVAIMLGEGREGEVKFARNLTQSTLMNYWNTHNTNTFILACYEQASLFVKPWMMTLNKRLRVNEYNYLIC